MVAALVLLTLLSWLFMCLLPKIADAFPASSKKLDQDSNPGTSRSEARPTTQRPPGSVPKGSSRPSSARNLSSMLKKEAKISEPSNLSGIPKH